MARRVPEVDTGVNPGPLGNRIRKCGCGRGCPEEAGELLTTCSLSPTRKQRRS